MPQRARARDAVRCFQDVRGEQVAAKISKFLSVTFDAVGVFEGAICRSFEFFGV